MSTLVLSSQSSSFFFLSEFVYRIFLLLLLKAQEPIPVDGQVKKVQLEIKDDDLPEPDEQVLVYLTDPIGGARVATDSDSGLQVSLTYVFCFEVSFCDVSHCVNGSSTLKVTVN